MTLTELGALGVDDEIRRVEVPAVVRVASGGDRGGDVGGNDCMTMLKELTNVSNFLSESGVVVFSIAYLLFEFSFVRYSVKDYCVQFLQLRLFLL